MHIEINTGRKLQEAFNSHSRGDSFTTEGFESLARYLNEIDYEGGKSTPLDVVDIDCSYSEYPSALEAAADHGFVFDDEDFEGYEPDELAEAKEDASKKWLTRKTTVIDIQGGRVILDSNF